MDLRVVPKNEDPWKYIVTTLELWWYKGYKREQEVWAYQDEVSLHSRGNKFRKCFNLESPHLSKPCGFFHQGHAHKKSLDTYNGNWTS